MKNPPYPDDMLGPHNSLCVSLGNEERDFHLMIQVRHGYPIEKALREAALILGRTANNTKDQES